MEGTEAGTSGPAGSEQPERIGHYRILEPLGEGGMGLVYLAEQEQPVRRRVALKVIKWGMDTKQVVARFESERQALALMNHPNIARVYDGGATPEGRPYFVMEYVKGEPITAYSDKQRLGTEQRLELFLQVCEGVQHAHHKGVIHRDLKPSNVLVRVQDGKAVPKIIDFGVAKATSSQRLTDKTLYTQLGTLVGTPEYMSPEQAEMTSLDIDTRTDVYSLGVLLYELLVGARPFDSKDLRAASFDEMRRRIREEEPSRPSTRVTTLGGEVSARAAERRRTDVRGLRRDLAGDLDWITLKALEKDRTRRYGSPMELAADIRRHMGHEPVLASPPSTGYRVKKFVRRHRAGVAAAGFAILALVLGVVLATVGMVRAERARGEAKREAETARQVSDFLVGLFEMSDPNASRGNTVTARELLDKGAERIERELAAQPLVQARMMTTIGRVYFNLGLYSPAGDLQERALAIRRSARAGSDLELAETLSWLGRASSWVGKYEEGDAFQAEALAIRSRYLPEDHEQMGWARYYRGEGLRNAGKHAEALAELDKALTILERTAGATSLGVAWCVNELAAIHEYSGDYTAAAQDYERALEIKEALLPPDHPDIAIALGNLAYMTLRLGDIDGARRQLDRALAISEKVLGGDDLLSSASLWGLGETWIRAGDPLRARPYLERALAIQSRVLTPDSTHLAATLHSLGVVLRDLGEFGQAEDLLRRAMAIREQSVAGGDLRLVETLNEYAALLRATGRPEETEAVESRARALSGGDARVAHSGTRGGAVP